MKHTVKYFLFFILLKFNNISFSKQNIIKNIRTSDKTDNVTTRIVLDLLKKLLIQYLLLIIIQD